MATGNEKVHPAANIFPMMDDDSYRGLLEDIRQHGQREPVVYWKQQLVDGRNRLKACKELGIDPETCELDDNTDPVAWVVSANLHRRHLNASQRSMVAAKVKKMYEPAAKAKKDATKIKNGKPPTVSPNLYSPPKVDATAKAADQLNVGRTSVAHAETVIKHGSKELQQKVESGDIAVSTAAKIAKEYPKHQQAKVADNPPERKEKTPYDHLVHWWEKASPEAQCRFRLYIDGEFDK